jgi:hypothetical protein
MAVFVTVIEMCRYSQSEDSMPFVSLEGPFETSEQADIYIQDQQRHDHEKYELLKREAPHLTVKPTVKYYDVHTIPRSHG